MLYPTTSKREVTYFVKSKVVFDIKSGNFDDECAKSYSAITLPTFTVSDSGSTTPRPYYLDCYIEDGDTFDGTNFKKTVHGTEDKDKTLAEYFEGLCKDALGKYYVDNNADELLKKKSAIVPPYMLKSNGYTVNGVTQIDDTDDERFIDEMNKYIWEECGKRAVSFLKKYKIEAKYDAANGSVSVAKLTAEPASSGETTEQTSS